MKKGLWLAAIATVWLITSCDLGPNGLTTTGRITNFKARYGFEESSGPTALNSAASYYKGTISGASRVTGFVGNGMQFNGTSLVQFGTNDDHSGDLPITFTGNRLSIGLWIDPTVSPAGKAMLLAGDSGLGIQSFLFVLNNGKLELRLYDEGTGFFSSAIVGTATVGQGQWTHVAVTYDGNTATTYVNGAEDATATYLHKVPTMYNDFRAGNTQDGQFGFVGIIDNLTVENATWTSTQVLALYNN